MSTIKALDNLREWANDRLDGYAHADAVRLVDEIEGETAEMREFCERVEKAARAIGYLEGFSCIVWAHVGENLADEAVAGYDEAVETLRKAVFKQEGDEK